MQLLEKTMENIKNHRDIKLVTTNARRNYLLSEPNYHTTTFFPENLLAVKMKKKTKNKTKQKTKILSKKHVVL